MNGRLIYDSLDPNDADVVRAVLRAAMLELALPDSWHDLDVESTCYFRTPSTQPPSGPGWYVIVDTGRKPLYVGESENLDSRLNSRDGSRDQFANPERTSDSTRNFLKRFVSAGMLEGLRAGIINEATVLQELRLGGPLSKRDRCSVEKILGIFRIGILTGPVNSDGPKARP